MANTLPPKLGFVGLGLMGMPMAQNLIDKTENTSHLYVFDVVAASMEKIARTDRVHACHSAKEVADHADVIISMVPEGSHVRSVYLDEKTGIICSDLGSKILIDCSTIDTATCLEVREITRTRHPRSSFYDAPVSGGVRGAVAGTLTFMLGCAEDDGHFELLNSLLGLMGRNIFACGGPGLGLTAKQCNNYCSGLIAIAVSESMNIGMRAGMDPRVLANIFHTSTAQSSILDQWSPVPFLVEDAPSSADYRGGFRVSLMKKDFGLAVDTAERVGARLALGRAGLQVYEEASEDPRCKDRDSRVVYRYLGGREDWKTDFPREVKLKKDDTQALLEWARQQRA